MFEILHRYTRLVVYRSETATDLRGAVLEAVGQSANLRYADLTSANLRYADLISADLTSANLTSANLRFANLRYANLRYADLTSANLRYANLTSANLRYANLRYANLAFADLRYADLTSANLTSANLISADLTSADLTSANLQAVKADFILVISTAPNEIPALRLAVMEGRVNGSVYQGKCACLLGTIANARGCSYDSIPGLSPDADRPAESFFMGIQKGDTPAKSPQAKLVLEWLDEFDGRMKAAYGVKAAA